MADDDDNDDDEHSVQDFVLVHGKYAMMFADRAFYFI